MEIRELHRDDLTASELTEVTRLANIVDPERLPDDPLMSEQLVHDVLSPGGRFYVQRVWATFDGDRAVALAQGEGSIVENADLFEIGVAVDPAMRRQGIGTALFEHIKQAASADGRTRFWSWGALDEANRKFWAEVAGLSLGYDERISRCVLADVDPELMTQWIERASDRASEYRIDQWVGRAPDHLVERFAVAREAMIDAPLDELTFEHETFDTERIRDLEEIYESKGLEHYVMMAIHEPSGECAGHTGVLVPRARPQLSWQGDTVTLQAHRNRGLGRWMKAAMWHWIRDERPEVLSLNTGNAESNDAMLAINVAMGFRGHLNLGVWHTEPSD